MRKMLRAKGQESFFREAFLGFIAKRRRNVQSEIG